MRDYPWAIQAKPGVWGGREKAWTEGLSRDLAQAAGNATMKRGGSSCKEKGQGERGPTRGTTLDPPNGHDGFSGGGGSLSNKAAFPNEKGRGRRVIKSKSWEKCRWCKTKNKGSKIGRSYRAHEGREDRGD